MTEARRSVAVVGGGITGLTAVHTLLSEAPDVDVTLLEGSDHLGGKLRTVNIGDVRLEAGADSFLVREPFALALCEDLGLRDELIQPAVFGGLVWGDKGARPLPVGAVMGVPTSGRNLLSSTAVPLRGRIRGLADLVLSGPLLQDDVAVGPFLGRRFGRAVVEKMVDPILAGTRAGDPDELSLRFAMPQVFAAAKGSRSVMRGLRSQVGAGATRPTFNAPRGGMGSLVAALRGGIDKAEIRTSTRVTRLSRAPSGFELVADTDPVQVGAVLLAIPAPIAADVVADLAPAASAELAGFQHASVASIGLVYEPGSLKFPAGSSGFLVPSGSGRLLNAGTWWSLKWPQAAGGFDVVRCFVGRAGRHPALGLDDDELARRAAEEVTELLGTSARPQATRVDRWDGGLPQYKVGHGEAMTRIEAELAAFPGLELAGADYRGTGIPDCVRQGTEAARRLIRYLNEHG